jgi:tetratricopeptide (TPR) repeat protein
VAFIVMVATLLILSTCWSALKARKKTVQQQQRRAAFEEMQRVNAQLEQPFDRSTAPALLENPIPPTHTDEDALVEAIIRAAANPESLRPWLDHPELGQVAKILMGAGLVQNGKPAEAYDYFDGVLTEPPTVAAESFFDRYPLPVPFHAAGIDTVVPLSRSVAAVYAAMICQTRGDSAEAMEAIEQADDSDLVTTMKSTYLFNLDRYDDVLRVTNRTSQPANTALEAFALILRGCALREMGRLTDALAVMNQAGAAALGTPSVDGRLNFEVGRTLAAQGNYAAARRKYVQVRGANPRFPGLEDALAELPTP